MKYSRNGLKIGDIVRITALPPGLKNSKEFKTLTLFKFCLGDTFRIHEFDRYNHLVFWINKRHPKFKPFRHNSICIEPDRVRRVRRAPKKV